MWMELISESRKQASLHQKIALFFRISLFFISVAALLVQTDISRLRTGSQILRWSNEVGLGRRRLGGPGSHPPRCAAKCGSCAPCLAVHVTVPPGTPTPAEYYPEAWRCKCGNRYYMPWLNHSN